MPPSPPQVRALESMDWLDSIQRVLILTPSDGWNTHPVHTIQATLKAVDSTLLRQSHNNASYSIHSGALSLNMNPSVCPHPDRLIGLFFNLAAHQDKVRHKDGRGRLLPDVFAETRLLSLPPGVVALHDKDSKPIPPADIDSLTQQKINDLRHDSKLVDYLQLSIPNLRRDPHTKLYSDDDLARIIQRTTKVPAGAFRARRVPGVLGVIEILGIRQARSWGAAPSTISSGSLAQLPRKRGVSSQVPCYALTRRPGAIVAGAIALAAFSHEPPNDNDAESVYTHIPLIIPTSQPRSIDNILEKNGYAGQYSLDPPAIQPVTRLFVDPNVIRAALRDDKTSSNIASNHHDTVHHHNHNCDHIHHHKYPVVDGCLATTNLGFPPRDESTRPGRPHHRLLPLDRRPSCRLNHRLTAYPELFLNCTSPHPPQHGLPRRGDVYVASPSTSPALPPALVDEVPRTITLLDTPGHVAFTAMRARGAGVRDILVLVIAADDGVVPQIRGVIALSKKDSTNEDGYGVGMVVAINKTAVKHVLLAEAVRLEEFGDAPCVEVSCLTGLGLDKLVETVSTLAEVKDLRARRTGRAEGCVLESRVDKGRGCDVGFISTILEFLLLVLTLAFFLVPLLWSCSRKAVWKQGYLIVGMTCARVQQITDSGEPVRSATPAFPLTISEWKESARTGDEVLEGGEDVVKNAIHNRNRNLAIRPLQGDVVLINEKHMEAKDMAQEAATSGSRIPSSSQASPVASNAADPSLPGPAEDHVKELRLIIKGDYRGPYHESQDHPGCCGEPTEADVDMVKAVNAMIIGFSVSTSHKVKAHAATSGVSIHTDTVIYRISTKSDLASVVQPILEVYRKHKVIIRVASCRVTNGVIERHKPVKVLRNDLEVYNGTLDALKHVKKDILEARKGSECGVSFASVIGSRHLK
ncbi:hypothetical protein BS47DRAFT_1394395 [Hydnum rufescens UP504]|uniref:Tr-type G domain-containing protein n=1 Tax=Hydnum rufescens UP504 TaxID=1448309 RepID=A0A9P6AWU9_9AGAM|nr:hypothetical protein BS47DRAFT_1394395 [Hydnum rufescens UP504]